MLSAPLRDRFGSVYRLDYYDTVALEQIVRRSARLMQVEIDEGGAGEIAQRARGTPRVANRLLRRVRDFAQVRAEGRIDLEVTGQALALLGVDPLGLDEIDRRVLQTIVSKYDGGSRRGWRPSQRPSARRPTRSWTSTNPSSSSWAFWPAPPEAGWRRSAPTNI